MIARAARATARALAALVAVAGLSACGRDAWSDGAGGPTLVMARVADAVVLDPAHAIDGISLDTSSEVMQNLVTFKPGSFDVTGDAARAWFSSADAKTWTFELRPGLRFSDGTPLDAKAVKFNLDRWRLTSSPAHGSAAYAYYAGAFGGFPGAIVDVRAPTATRVVVRLASPLTPFLRDVAEQPFGLGSPAAIEADPAAFDRKPVGSGPYMIGEWVRDEYVKLVANPAWHGTRPGYRTVIIRAVPDQGTGMLSLEHGDVDMLTDPRPDDVRSLGAKPGIATVQVPSNNVSYVALDVEKNPFGDVRVRRAVAYALDAAAIVKNLYPAGAVVADNWTPPGMLGQNGSVKTYPHDAARARALLAEAGLPHGFATTLAYATAPRPYLPQPKRVAEAIQANLREAGIEVTLQPYEWGAFLDRVAHGRHEMCLTGWTGDNGDPDNFFYPLLDRDAARSDGNGQNYAFWRDPAFHRLMLRGRTTVAGAQRAATYRAANAMVHAQAPAIPLAHTTVPVLLKSSIKGFVPSPNTSYHFDLIQAPAGG